MKSKILFFAALIAYFLTLNLGPEHPWWAAASFAASFLFAALSGETREYEKIDPKAVLVLYAGLLLLALFLIRESIRDNREDSRFATYLDVHKCKAKGMDVTGYTDLENDRFSGPSGGDEIKEMIYYCRATGLILSRTDFDSGYFGELPD